MRYLWVEDFNNGNCQDELKKHWMQYYGLDNKELIVKTNLEDAIEYINDNPEYFDAVLLDINFPITLSKTNDKTIYDKHLKGIITYKFYETNNQTGAGMLLFLYLILKNRWPKERIAFLSANIENTLENDMAEALSIIEGVRDINNISGEQKDSYDALIPDLKKKYGNTVKWKYLDEISDLNEYVDLIRSASALININEKNNCDVTKSPIKYNKAQIEFEKVGFNLSEAFPKPENQMENQNEKFLSWMENIESEYCIFRRCIIEMCNIILPTLDDDIIIYNNRYNGKNTKLSIAYLEELLENLRLMPLAIEKDKENHQYKRIVSQISHHWESAKKPVYFCPQDDFTVMCTNYKECVLSKFGYKKKVAGDFYCIRENYNEHSCEHLIENRKCSNRDTCTFSNDYKSGNKNRVSWCSGIDKCKYQYTIQDFAYQSVLKMVRNWLAHSKIKYFDVYTASFIFGIGMRALFDIDALENQEYVKWENKLLNLIAHKKNTKISDLIFEDKTIENAISKSCFDFYKVASNLNDFAYTPNLSYIIHTIGGENSSVDCNTQYILRLFAHCLFPIEIQPKADEKVSDYSLGLNINTDLLKNRDLIEFKYFRAIYSKAFANLMESESKIP